MATPGRLRSHLAGEARRLFLERHPNALPHASCLYWALAVIRACRECGIRAILQAGTAMWPRLRPEQDDGLSPTHFSYVWEPEAPLTLERLANNLLPEMHVWAAVPAEQEMVDLTTSFWPEQCQRLLGRDWPGDLPPSWLWATCEELPERVVYQADLRAIVAVYQLLRNGTLS